MRRNRARRIHRSAFGHTAQRMDYHSHCTGCNEQCTRQTHRRGHRACICQRLPLPRGNTLPLVLVNLLSLLSSLSHSPFSLSLPSLTLVSEYSQRLVVHGVQWNMDSDTQSHWYMHFFVGENIHIYLYIYLCLYVSHQTWNVYLFLLEQIEDNLL